MTGPVEGLGRGLFVRSLAAISPEDASRLGHVAVPVDVRGRNINRALAWYAKATTRKIAWSWFTIDPGEFREAIAFAAQIGASAFVVNGEKELRGKPQTARLIAALARQECDRHGLALGLVSYSIPGTVTDFPWSVFARHCHFGMPEVYDREGRYDPTYPRRAIASWHAHGFGPLLPAGAVYQREDDGQGWRWRTPEEIARHLALFPDGAPDVTCWTLGNTIPESVIAALAAPACP